MTGKQVAFISVHLHRGTSASHASNTVDTLTTFSLPRSAFQYILETVEWLQTGVENYAIQDREAPKFTLTELKTTGCCNSPLLYTVTLMGVLVYVQVVTRILMWFTKKPYSVAITLDCMKNIAHSGRKLRQNEHRLRKKKKKKKTHSVFMHLLICLHLHLPANQSTSQYGL